MILKGNVAGGGEFHLGAPTLLRSCAPKIVVCRARRTHQVVVWTGTVLPVRVVYSDALLLFIHSANSTQNHRCVSIFPENPTDGRANLSIPQYGRCDLIKQGFK
ncbi:MAG: hypothetical protein QOJ99_6008 [Bryobacterales bacterium]|nr:hypothetical protein [Bryobacterales bacterium]